MKVFYHYDCTASLIQHTRYSNVATKVKVSLLAFELETYYVLSL